MALEELQLETAGRLQQPSEDGEEKSAAAQRGQSIKMLATDKYADSNTDYDHAFISLRCCQASILGDS